MSKKSNELQKNFLHSIGRGDVEKVKSLIESKADVTLKDKNGMTPLHNTFFNSYVEKEKSCDIAKALIKNGADLYKEDNRGNTPIQLAITFGCSKNQTDDLILFYYAIKCQSSQTANEAINNQKAVEATGEPVSYFENCNIL